MRPWRAIVTTVVFVAVLPAMAAGASPPPPPPPPPTATAAAAGVSPATAPGDAATSVRYRAPVDGPILDGFAAHAGRYGPGNRGVTFATVPGRDVVAAADGTVTFAGRVAGALHVVVLHRDGLRTSYSFLATTTVAAGATVVAGQPIGTAGTSVHFGLRDGANYLDPRTVLGGPPSRVRLLPDHPGVERGGPGAPEREADGLRRLLSAVGRPALAAAPAITRWALGAAGAAAAPALTGVARQTLPAAAATAAEALSVLQHLPTALVPGGIALGVLEAAATEADRQCTPATAPPPPPSARRVVLVGGLGSSSGAAAVLDVDATALGAGPGDTVQFSYRGGTAVEHPYRPEDTAIDVRDVGSRLRALLLRMASAHPSQPVVVVAHSLGGVVAREALAGPPIPGVTAVVTLGTPHRGADLAGDVRALVRSSGGRRAGAALSRVLDLGVTADSPSVRQLAPGSSEVRRLATLPLPPMTVLSLAAVADPVVPSWRSSLPGAVNAIVVVASVDQHGALPGSGAAGREMRLVLAGQPPSCVPLALAMAEVLLGRAISSAEGVAGVALGAAGLAIP